MEVNVKTSDSKSGFQSYLNQYNCQYPAILGGEGGAQISNAVGNGTSGNPKYLIYPDKTYGRYTSLPSTVQPHDCNPTPTIKVTYPDGGESLQKDRECEITWTSKNITGNVKIELLRGNAVESVLASSEDDDGSFMWNVSSSIEVGDNFEIRISSITGPSVTDKSDDYFSITDEIIIVGDYNENFDTLESGSEDLPVGYFQSFSDDFNWLVLSGPTPSKVGASPNITGPNGDQTSGGASGNYLYVEASDPNNPGKNADFETPKINISDLENPELTFYYHMFSDSGHMGSLEVDVCSDGQWSNGEIVLDESDYGDEWHSASIDLNPFRSRSEWVKFRFTATTGMSWASDICIDGIEVKGNQVSLSKESSIIRDASFGMCKSQLKYSLPMNLIGKNMKISIFNMQGKEIYNKSDIVANSGIGKVDVMGTDIANGIYTARLKIGDYMLLTNFVISK